jgi:transposase InsO family protein
MFRAACKRIDLRQIFIRPYTPKTNGKAERFIQTALREWAYAQAYHSSHQRTANCPIGSIATIGIGRMVAYGQRHLSAVSVWPRTTS